MISSAADLLKAYTKQAQILTSGSGLSQELESAHKKAFYAQERSAILAQIARRQETVKIAAVRMPVEPALSMRRA